MIKKILSILIIVFGLLFSSVKSSKAQTANYSCIGNALAQYMNQVIQTAGNLTHVRLLSPAFNMTNPNGAAIASAMVSSGANFAALSGVAGNAYNCCTYPAAPNGKITEHVAAFRAASGLTSLPVLITETGVFDGTVEDLRFEMDRVQTNSSYIGALLFNAFDGNKEWTRFSFENNDIIKNQVCNGSCNKLGVNSATFYPEGDEFYDRANDLRVAGEIFFTLSIGSSYESILEGVEKALNRRLTPVIRIGTTYDAGPDALTYAQWLRSIDDEVNGTVYAIAGPNEPQSECWAAPECGCDLSPVNAQHIRRPLEEGFYLGKYSCGINDVAVPEFHPLRPYPASSCDLLIPKSDPEAPENTLNTYENTYDEKADFQKYNTFACGSSLDFSHEEIFDPYGDYEETIVEDSFGNQFLHTYCNFADVPESDLTSIGYYDLTCYRTVGYDVYGDFSNTNIGILGNTQNINLTDEQKMNNYLSWYFSGTPQVGDRKLLDPEEPGDMDRLVNFSGPIRKLLPYEAQQAIREVLRLAAIEETNDVHNYALDIKSTLRLANISDVIEQYFPNIPNSTLEDVPGEAHISSYEDFHDASFSFPVTEEDPDPLGTAPYSFNIVCGVGAHESCPGGGAGVVSSDGGGGD
jgi:hypothetical protein